MFNVSPSRWSREEGIVYFCLHTDGTEDFFLFIVSKQKTRVTDVHLDQKRVTETMADIYSAATEVVHCVAHLFNDVGGEILQSGDQVIVHCAFDSDLRLA